MSRLRNPIYELGAVSGFDFSQPASAATPSVLDAAPRNLVDAGRQLFGPLSPTVTKVLEAADTVVQTVIPQGTSGQVDSQGRPAPGPGYWLVSTPSGKRWTNDPRMKPQEEKVITDASGVTTAAIVGGSVYLATPPDLAAVGLSIDHVPGLRLTLENQVRAQAGLPQVSALKPWQLDAPAGAATAGPMAAQVSAPMSPTMKVVVFGGLGFLALKLFKVL